MGALFCTVEDLQVQLFTYYRRAKNTSEEEQRKRKEKEGVILRDYLDSVRLGSVPEKKLTEIFFEKQIFTAGTRRSSSLGVAAREKRRLKRCTTSSKF